MEIEISLVEADRTPASPDARGEETRRLHTESPPVSTLATGAPVALHGAALRSDALVQGRVPNPAVLDTAGVGPILPPSARVVERAHAEVETDRGGPSDGVPPHGAPVVVTPPHITDLGIGLREANRFVPTSAQAVEAAERRRAIDRALKDPARAKEQALGLGPEGPVLTALADGTARSIAPVRGRAVFVATTDAGGSVTSLELLDAEGGRPGWDDARRLALVGLEGKKLRLPPGTTRAVMKIEVVSTWKLPSGQDPGADITLFHIPIAKGEGKDSAKVALLDPIPKLRRDVIELGPGVQFPIVSWSIDILRTDADPTNFGAKPRRVIHTRALESTAM